jgi:hypothetical protein
MVHIYPKNHFNQNFYNLIKVDKPLNYLWGNNQFLFFQNAKNAIHNLVHQLNLKREDEVFISTSSNLNYVSTCVSATLFNYCKIARVLTEKTKLIYVIHEFGIPNPEIINLVDLSKKLNIPLLEDCAHGIESYFENERIGTLGNYALYSLSKHFPINNGGLLVGKELLKHSEFYNLEIAKQVEESYYTFLPYLESLSQKRKDNFKFIRNQLLNVKVHNELNDSITPYTINFNTTEYKSLFQHINGKVAECLPVYIPNWFCIPTQPLANESEFKKIATIINQKLNE